MRRFLIAIAASFAAFGVGAQSVLAQEFTVTLGSSYIDTATFNDRFSDEPVVQVSATFDLGDGFYAEPYASSGFKSPFNDASSEYGLEIGWEGDLAEDVTLNVAAGRWANYGGAGFDEGDWFLKVGVTHGNLTVAVSALQGASDTAILHVAYELPVNDRLSLTPSAAFSTRDGTVNPGVAASYRLTDAFSLNAMVVVPERPGGSRQVYAGVSIAWTF